MRDVEEMGLAGIAHAVWYVNFSRLAASGTMPESA
ncbi:hypothetical protein AWB69_07451 [Caballeronia udeis]|uniref:Uncharacterized protein n=1 Tax=Caballeronia udeis TaxID=1232866 RepID=A0A158JB43_9BURK|nr:hypothetical protein AWB69_07451 [Caballeronia udeis]